MSNFIIIGSKGKGSSIRNAVFGDIAAHAQPNVHYLYVENPTGPARLLHRIVSSKKLNRIVKMPLRTHWEIQFKDVEPLLSSTEDNYIIFTPGTQIFERTSLSLLKKLRKARQVCRSVYYFVDGVERTLQMSGVSEAYLLDFLKNFDYTCTYSRQDAEKYGFDFIEIPVWHSPNSASKASNLLYFSGADKKRVNLLVDIKKRLDPLGIAYNFHIVPSLSSDRSRTDIQYSASKPYEEIVNDVLETNCVLEILAVFNTSATLRYKEAVIYNKKLLTTNPEITRLPYYDARWMRYFEKAEDIDLEWLRTVEPADYGYKGDFSALHFLDTVEKKYREHQQK